MAAKAMTAVENAAIRFVVESIISPGFEKVTISSS
jgi:hypothetical protein